MEDASEIERMERQRAALLAEATQIVQTAEAHSRKVTSEEDEHVLKLMDGVRTLEEQIGHLRRHRQSGQPQNRSETR
jgi:hypothetical protein